MPKLRYRGHQIHYFAVDGSAEPRYSWEIDFSWGAHSYSSEYETLRSPEEALDSAIGLIEAAMDERDAPGLRPELPELPYGTDPAVLETESS